MITHRGAMEGSYWRGRRVLVTGGSSFIAASLVRRLLELGAEVNLLVRQGSSLWRLAELQQQCAVCKGDIADRDAVLQAVSAASPGVIFHLATARGSELPASQYISTSINAAAYLLEGLKLQPSPPRLVVAGSSMEYAPGTGAMTERHPIAPRTLHGTVKAAAGLLYAQAAYDEAHWIKQLRIFHVYGPWESSHRFLSTAIRLALAGEAVPLVAGESRRDWVYVDDVVEALLLAATVRSSEHIFNVGSGLEHDNVEVLAVLEEILGRRISTLADALPVRPSDSAHRCANIALAADTLGWSPRYQLKDGLEATLAWMRAHAAAKSSGDESAPTVI
ncbi:MAG: NAD-dependent epimerase/dehydratase family protein [Pseudomonadota bacterium]